MKILIYLKNKFDYAYKILSSISKSPYKIFCVFIVQPFCLLILFTTFLEKNNFLQYLTNEIISRTLLYILAFVGIFISAIEKYNFRYIQQLNAKLSKSSFLANLVILLIRALILIIIIKLCDVQFDRSIFPVMLLFMLQG